MRKKCHHTNDIQTRARQTPKKDDGTKTNSNRILYGARYRILVGRRRGAVQNEPARIAAGKFGRHATAAVPRALTAEFGRPVAVAMPSAMWSAIRFGKALFPH